MAGLVGWLVGMVTRQSGHIFWEPQGHDPIHDVSYEYKESIKAGYNMHRKSALIGLWLSIPVVLLWKSPLALLPGELLDPMDDILPPQRAG